MLTKQDIIEKMLALDLPLDQYVIVGSGSLAAHGIREANDIDMVVMPELFEALRRKGWTEKIRPNGKPKLQLDQIEAMLDVNKEGFQPTTEELIERSVVIDGIRFTSLQDVRAFKVAYGREKDVFDIELIDRFAQS